MKNHGLKPTNSAEQAKIYEDQNLINERKKQLKTNRDILRGINTTVYSSIDMLITMEHLYQLIQDIFSTRELRQYFDKKTYQVLNKTKEISKSWKFVRNKLGGHIDISVVEEFCEKHGYKGVFISDDLAYLADINEGFFIYDISL